MKTEKDTQKIRTILAARRALYQAGADLLECDDAYAGRIKAELEKLVFATGLLTFEDGKETEKPLDEVDVRFYLEMVMRIYVREENIVIDRQKNLCRIKLNDRTEATVAMKNGRAVQSILFKEDAAADVREKQP